MNSTWLENLCRIGLPLLSVWRSTYKLAPIVVTAIAGAESIVGASGADKRRAALAAVDHGVAQFNRQFPTEAIDPSNAREVAGLAIDALVATVNLWTRTPIGS